jgi:hypothetical protein
MRCLILPAFGPPTHRFDGPQRGMDSGKNYQICAIFKTRTYSSGKPRSDV